MFHSFESSELENLVETGVKAQTQVNLKLRYQNYMKILREEVLQPTEDTKNTLL